MSADELRGACKVWEICRAIFISTTEGGMTNEEFYECFGTVLTKNVWRMDCVDFIKKYEAWKAKKEAFHVGDEVKFKTEELFVVTWVGETTGNITVMDKDGFCCTYRNEHFTKTGRTYPQIKDVIDGLRYACHASCASSSASDAEGSTERG